MIYHANTDAASAPRCYLKSAAFYGFTLIHAHAMRAERRLCLRQRAQEINTFTLRRVLLALLYARKRVRVITVRDVTR